MNAPQSNEKVKAVQSDTFTPLPLYRNAEQERSAKPLGNECRNFSLFLYQSLFENSFDFVGIDTALSFSSAM